MILAAGGTGHLGTELVPLLAARGHSVRVLTRDPESARRRLGDVADVVAGDARDPGSLARALSGARAVVSAMTGFGPGGLGPRAVDHLGNLNLIQAAEVAGVDRFVLVSMHGASANHPMELLREKHRAEQALRASRLKWTVVRPTVFMELWAGIIGDPILKAGRTTVFGSGSNPVNFVSVRDVAAAVALALQSNGLHGQAVEVGGPENLSLNQLVQQVERLSGRKARVRRVPVPVMQFGRMLMRLVKPDIAGLIEAGIAMATTDMTFDAAGLQAEFPDLARTPVIEVLRRRFSAGASRAGGALDAPQGERTLG